MVRAFYDCTFILSLVLLLAYVCIWHKHFDIHISLVFALVPVINLGYMLLGRAQTLEAALLANKLTYIGGCFLMPIMMFSVYSLCHIPLSRWIRVGWLAINTAIYLTAVTNGQSGLFYRSVALKMVDGTVTFVKVYGPMHTAFYATIILCMAVSIAGMVYSYCHKKQVSRKLICLLFLPVALSFISFFAGRKLFRNIELIPAAYVIAMAVYIIISWRICLYDVMDTATDSIVENGETGFISFDFRFNYLGSNSMAKRIFPELNDLTVDWPVDHSATLRDTAMVWLSQYRQDATKNQFHFEKDGRVYLIRIVDLFDGHRIRGYQFFITDDTADQQYIGLLNRFNTELQSEVSQKTAHIVEMHDKLILGMATMVESRDNSTGGHIRRTSKGVRLLVDELRSDDAFALSEDFCRNLIKAAPMHDLGKIAVDDAVLRKPGRFTPEEFEKMKAHAAEGARIVHDILTGVEDDGFRVIAENVAHYHHERWDGSGYPEGLKGDEIPIEARIMAIADVYDALVSKRVYKESMSFEQADAIIMEGMGKHFDKRLEPYYLQARPKLEDYYLSLRGA